MDLYNKLREMKMLLIDDDEWIRDSLSIFFEGEGCQIKALETAEEGLEALKKQSYDIIIVDYRLPGMDGLDFLKRIKDTTPSVMKILITAYGSENVVTDAKQMGIQDLIEKPFTTKTIEASLSRLIGKHDQ
jgi:DNA-binding NtrC family response regulator